MKFLSVQLCFIIVFFTFKFSGAQTWQHIEGPSARVLALQEHDGASYALTDNGLFRSTDDWASYEWAGASDDGTNAFFELLSSGENLFAVSAESWWDWEETLSLSKYDRENNLWITIDLPHNINKMPISDNGSLYIIGQTQVSKSTDAGNNWEKIIEDSSSFFALNFYAHKNHYFHIKDSIFLRSSDNGKNWTRLDIATFGSYGPLVMSDSIQYYWNSVEKRIYVSKDFFNNVEFYPFYNTPETKGQFKWKNNKLYYFSRDPFYESQTRGFTTSNSNHWTQEGYFTSQYYFHRIFDAEPTSNGWIFATDLGIYAWEDNQENSTLIQKIGQKPITGLFDFKSSLIANSNYNYYFRNNETGQWNPIFIHINGVNIYDFNSLSISPDRLIYVRNNSTTYITDTIYPYWTEVALPVVSFSNPVIYFHKGKYWLDNSFDIWTTEDINEPWEKWEAPFLSQFGNSYSFSATENGLLYQNTDKNSVFVSKDGGNTWQESTEFHCADNIYDAKSLIDWNDSIKIWKCESAAGDIKFNIQENQTERPYFPRTQDGVPLEKFAPFLIFENELAISGHDGNILISNDLSQPFGKIDHWDFSSNPTSALFKSDTLWIGTEQRGIYFRPLTKPTIPSKPLSINLFPNPCTNQILISSPANYKTNSKQILIYNQLGQINWSESNLPGLAWQVDTQSWASGIYFVKVLFDEVEWIGRFIKQ